MRSLPVELFYKDYEKMLQVTELQAKMTHYSQLSTNTCLIYNEIAYRILNHGEDLRTAIHSVISHTKFHDVINNKPQLPPSGFSEASLQWTLYWLLHTDTFEDAVYEAVNYGGDTDSIGSMVGGLVGLYYGFSSIPDHLIKGLWKRKKIERLSFELMKAREQKMTTRNIGHTELSTLGKEMY